MCVLRFIDMNFTRFCVSSWKILYDNKWIINNLHTMQTDDHFSVQFLIYCSLQWFYFKFELKMLISKEKNKSSCIFTKCLSSFRNTRNWGAVCRIDSFTKEPAAPEFNKTKIFKELTDRNSVLSCHGCFKVGRETHLRRSAYIPTAKTVLDFNLFFLSCHHFDIIKLKFYNGP